MLVSPPMSWGLSVVGTSSGELASIWPDTSSESTFGAFVFATAASLLADCTCILDCLLPLSRQWVKVKCREGHHRCHFHRYAHPASAADSLQWWSVGGLNFLTEGSSCHFLDRSWSQGSNRLRCKVRLSPWPASGLTLCTGLPSPFLAITTWISSSQKARSFPGPPQGVRLRTRTGSPTCNAEDLTRFS